MVWLVSKLPLGLAADAAWAFFFSLPWTLIRQSNEPCLPCHLLLIGAWWSSLSSSFFVCSFFHGTSLLTITIRCLFRMHLNRNIVIVIEYWERRQTGLVFLFLSPMVLFPCPCLSFLFSSTSFCHGHVGTPSFFSLNSSIIISSARLNAIRAFASSSTILSVLVNNLYVVLLVEIK